MNFKMLIIVGGLAVAGGSVHAAPPEVEAEIDRQLGILDREWVVAPVRILGRRALRMEAGVVSGLPDYRQEAERAQRAPQSLVDALAAPPAAPSPPPAGGKKPEPEPPPPEVIIIKKVVQPGS